MQSPSLLQKNLSAKDLGFGALVISQFTLYGDVRKGRRPEFDLEDPAFIADPAAPPDETIQSGQMRVRIRDAMAQLPEEQATVIRLSFFEDKPHGEIATQLDLPLGTVKSRLRLAMRRIRTLLGE